MWRAPSLRLLVLFFLFCADLYLNASVCFTACTLFFSPVGIHLVISSSIAFNSRPYTWGRCHGLPLLIYPVAQMLRPSEVSLQNGHNPSPDKSIFHIKSYFVVFLKTRSPRNKGLSMSVAACLHNFDHWILQVRQKWRSVDVNFISSVWTFDDQSTTP